MVVRLKRLYTAAVIALISAGLSDTAIAQDAPDTAPPQVSDEEVTTTLEAFEEAFFDSSGNFYENRGFPGNLTWFLGPFPENNISRDSRDVHRVYIRVMTEQALSDPIIRTPDLASPFDTSLLLYPATQALTRPQEAPAATVETPPPPAPAPTPMAAPQSPPPPVRALF